MAEIKGLVHSVESFGSADGPGVRFIVFLQGCKFRCQFCHNPDTWNLTSSLATEKTADELINQALRYKSYWGEKGGITVSGGEPLLQIDFLIDLFRKAKAQGINTCIDTAGQPFTREEPFFSKFNELMKYTDLLLLDIKHIDNEKHKIITGHSNENVLDMAKYLSDINKPVWIRYVLVPGSSDDEDSLNRLHSFLSTLNNVQRIDVLPYHTLGVFKYKELGLNYQLEGVKPPTQESIDKANHILQA